MDIKCSEINIYKWQEVDGREEPGIRNEKGMQGSLTASFGGGGGVQG